MGLHDTDPALAWLLANDPAAAGRTRAEYTRTLGTTAERFATIRPAMVPIGVPQGLPDDRGADALYSPDPETRYAFVRWLMQPPAYSRKRRVARPLRLHNLLVTHPGAVAHGQPTAIVVGYACRRCGTWRDRVTSGRRPLYCGGNCRQSADRARRRARKAAA